MSQRHLRPLERTVLRLADEGMPQSEIAWRFRRSPGHIKRVIDLTQVPRSGIESSPEDAPTLRPVERIVLRAREQGIDYTEIGARLRRSPGYAARVESYANYKLAAEDAR